MLYDTIVVSASGARAFYQLGAILAFTHKKLLHTLTTYVGTSNGAIIALLLSCNYSTDEIIQEFIETSLFKDLNNFSITNQEPKNGKLTHVLCEEKLGSLLKRKFGIIPSMKRLYEITGNHLILVTSNLTKNTVVGIDYKTEPGLSVIDAIFLSMNTAGVMNKTVYKDDIYIDGSFGNPYPINLVDDGRRNIIGFNTCIIPDGVNISDYLYRVMLFPVDQIKQKVISVSSDRCHHVPVDISYFDMTGVGASEEERYEMVSKGMKIADCFLTKDEIPSNIILHPGDQVEIVEDY